MFDEVVVAVGVNIDKRGFFPNEKRIDIIRQATAGLSGVSVIQYDNLTIDKCRELGIRHIVRGARNMIDFETERSIADANRKLAPDIETIIIPTAQEYAHISSTAVRDLLKHGVYHVGVVVALYHDLGNVKKSRRQRERAYHSRKYGAVCYSLTRLF